MVLRHRGERALISGDWVQVLSEDEILATLDSEGRLDGLPFMPEMLRFCGHRFRVAKVAHKTCDTIEKSGGRRMRDAVHLEGVRCDGSAHGDCQARCMIFWKDSWLARIDDRSGERVREPVVGAWNRQAHQSGDFGCCTRDAITRAATPEAGDGAAEPRYACQATELLRATTPLPWWSPGQYLRDLRSSNVGLGRMIRVSTLRILENLIGIGIAFRFFVALHDALQRRIGGSPYPRRAGQLTKTPSASLGLQIGERVRVKDYEDIVRTLDRRNRNRGLYFDIEMVPYCGTTRTVVGRVERIINEKTGRMMHFGNDCIILSDVVCRAEHSMGRMFCPRAIYSYWREIWLDRLDDEGADGR